MNIATITPTRDRKVLLDFCMEQMERQTIHPLDRYFIHGEPKDNKPDLTARIRSCIEIAKSKRMDWVVIIEDDDFYPQDYIERFIPHMEKYDFIGDQESLYYNIKTRRYQVFKHPHRASLFTTAFRVSALDKFKWPADDYVFLDIKLWQHARKFKCKFINSGALGIKGHGIGKSGGKGHVMKLRNEDPDMSFFKSKVSEWHFEFYKTLI